MPAVLCPVCVRVHTLCLQMPVYALVCSHRVPCSSRWHFSHLRCDSVHMYVSVGMYVGYECVSVCAYVLVKPCGAGAGAQLHVG